MSFTTRLAGVNAMPKHLVADKDGIRVMAERCSTCIFKPGNLMELRSGRVKDMVEGVKEIDGCIPCHETLGDEVQAVCRGQYEAHKTWQIEIAERLGKIIDWVRPEDK